MTIKKEGFTLIELIVVFAIITILGSMLLPNYLSYITRANSAKKEQIERMVFTASMRSYFEDNGFVKSDVQKAIEEDISMNKISINANSPSLDGKNIVINISDNSNNYAISINGVASCYSEIGI